MPDVGDSLRALVSVNYQDFKVVETNLRAAHDAIRALAQGVKDLNETIARQTGLIQQLQFRLSRVEARVYGEEPKDAA